MTVKNARRLDAKAATLPVEYVGWGRFVVASGSTPGAVYHVQADHNADDVTGWDCDCPWGARVAAGECSGACSHVRAAHGWITRYRAAQARKAARVLAAQAVTA